MKSKVDALLIDILNKYFSGSAYFLMKSGVNTNSKKTILSIGRF